MKDLSLWNLSFKKNDLSDALEFDATWLVFFISHHFNRILNSVIQSIICQRYTSFTKKKFKNKRLVFFNQSQD